jgi:hypothetical protein
MGMRLGPALWWIVGETTTADRYRPGSFSWDD